jgi:NAD(P)-dependent dehydrogenase (short-subunit alcohol dehydrogenase family)
VYRTARTRALLLIFFAGMLSGVTTISRAQSTEGPVPGQQVVLITGSTSGLGREVALRVAATGAHVIVHGRNEERGAEVVQQIQDSGVGSARFYRSDFASLADVRALSDAIRRDYDRLDVLVNNAGIATTRSGEREVSEDGYELIFAVNYLAGFLLTHELLPLLEAGSPSRIVNVSSLAQAPLDFENVMLEEGYNNIRAYSQSKLAQIFFTFDLAEALDGTGVLATCLHPATMMDTNMVAELGAQPRSSVDEGADAVMHLITGPDVKNGSYYVGLSEGRARDQAYDRAARDRLHALSLEWTGLTGD